MSGGIPVVGAKIYIGDKSWAYDTLTEYDSQLEAGWTELGQLEDFDDFGDETQISNIPMVGTGRVKKVKTFDDAGNMMVRMLNDPADDGQVALLEARADKASDYPFRIIMPDDPGGTGSKPTRFYFRALVGSNRHGKGAPDALRRTVMLAINTEVIEGAAVAGS
jgi:hypothetical protein